MILGYKVISFDMEGTLVDHSFSRAIWEIDIPRLYSEAYLLDFEEAKRKVLAEYQSIGDLRPEWYDVNYWWSRFKLPGDWSMLPLNRRNTCTVYPEIEGVLERLGRIYPLIVTSNTIKEFLDVQLSCINHKFSYVFSAPSDYGETKKTPGFYTRLCRELKVKPWEMAHIGDNLQHDYEAARAIGIKSYFLNRSSKLYGADIVHDLEEFEKLLKP